MCTMITESSSISGSAKGAKGWFTLREVNVSFDHPYHAPLEHALNIDFVNESEGLGSRVAVELTPESARELMHLITVALERAEATNALPVVPSGATG